jgi:dihydrofolate synthase/folylpolyglutamate synthase
VTYEEAVEYLFSQLPMFHRIGAAAYKPDIGNISQLCEALGNPHLKFPVVHIAGSNGKGSTSHLTASVLMEAGYKVGLFTSPHLKDYRERIRVNGKKIDPSFVANFVEQSKESWKNIEPSFFEITTALAFHYFAQEQVDIAVIEVGMGGRLDSTNIVQPVVTAITSISLDHTQFLGDTLELIAKEKAGIIKENIPVVLGEIPFGARQEIIEIAQLKNAPLTMSASLLPPKSALEGSYQLFNEKTSFGILLQLQKMNWNISNENIAKGFLRVIENTHLMGRWQILATDPLTVAEVAHNEEGITFLVGKIKTLSFHKLHIVIGMVNDKDHSQVLSLLPKEAEYYFVQADIPRALPKEELQAKASEFMLKGNCYPNVHSGLEAAKAAGSKEDLIVITGSIFTVAEILPEED